MQDRRSIHRHLGAAFAALLWIGLAAAAARAEGVSAADDPAKPFIVKIHADWCGTCTRMNPTFDALDRDLGAEARVVILDVTDQETLAQATAEADRLGIREFFEAHKSKTGTVGVLHGATRRTVVVMKGETDVARYRAAVAEAASGSAS